jgi:hypothetical protein
MTTIAVASDNIRSYSQDLADLTKFCEALRKAGYEVIQVGVGSNEIQYYSKRHTIDIMIQIAGGLCCGTLGDFIMGIGKYYHAKKGSIVYNMIENNLNPETHPCRKSDDWYYDMTFINAHKEEKYPDIYKQFSNKTAGFAWGKNIDEVIKNYLAVLGGGTNTNTADTQQSGGSILELMKQVTADLDPYGVELDLVGDEVYIHKSHPEKANKLTTDMIINNSVSFTDYDSNTPNTNGTAKDQYLIDRFGTIALETDITTDKAQVLQIAKRGHGHSLDLKVVLDYRYIAGEWVSLTIPSLNLKNRKYYISKASYDSERTMSLTLDPAPPSLYTEVPEAPTETETTETTEEEEEE